MPPTEMMQTVTISTGTTAPGARQGSGLMAPANTLIGTAGERQIAEQQQNNLAELSHGTFGGFTNLFSCIPLPRWSIWPSGARAQKALEPADVCNDNFEIALECIDVDFQANYVGGGTQSSVFWAKWNGQLIALKKLNRASEVDIRKLAALEHPNIVRTLGMCNTGFPCIISEFCEKGSLFDVLRQGPIGKSKFVRWAKEVANGMQYLHLLHIVHRDLKSPNVLVDANDTLKICDFGTLYTMETTHMASAKMSMVGTAQWMSPEVLKNEPCNEKLDVWSYGVLLWELLTQEIPFKRITSMAVVFGVGSGNLRLYCPSTVPISYKLLLKLCFAQRPRNRPSFSAILNHLANLAAECDSISADAWVMRKEAWKKELDEEAEKLRVTSNGNANCDAKQLSDQKAEELVSKRMHELRHAQELASMYRGKMRRANRLNKELYRCLQELSVREAAIAEKEAQIRVRAATTGPTSTYSPPVVHKNASVSVPELKSVRLQKSTVARANARGNKTTISVYPRGGQRAVVAMEVSEDESNEEEELFESDAESEKHWGLSCNARTQDSTPITPATSTRRISAVSSSSSEDEQSTAVALCSRHSYVASSRQESFEEGRGFTSTSRVASARSSIAHRHAVRNASASYLPTTGEDSTVCPHCSCDCRAFHFGVFQRNSTARVSGISADSGVVSAGVDERRTSALMLDVEENGNSHSPSTLAPDVLFYRNDQARWSDGRISRQYPAHRHPFTAPNSSSRHRLTNRHSTAFARNSPARVPSASRHRAISTSRRPIVSGNSIDCVHDSANSPQTSQPQIYRSHSEEADVPMDMSTEAPSRPSFSRRTIDEVIAEMSSSLSSKSNRSPKKGPLMEQSTTSTMATSLERSLEAALAYDGLSDKEQKLKAVKSSFRTHRRCASNPTCIVDKSKCIARIAETSIETSDQDPVYS